MTSSKTDKVLTGIVCAIWIGSGVGTCANIYASAESEAALTQEAKHAIVLENRLDSDVSVKFLIQNPEVVQIYVAIQQEYDSLMAKEEVQQSINNSKSYTNKWYCNADVRRASMIGFMFLPAVYGISALCTHIEKKLKNKKEQAKTKTE